MDDLQASALIPHELNALIVDHLSEDSSTMLRLGYISKFFLKITRDRLFSTLIIHSRAQLISFFVLLSTSSWTSFTESVQEIRFNCPWRSEANIFDGTNAIHNGIIRSHLNCLESLVLVGMEWDSMPPYLIRTLQELPFTRIKIIRNRMTTPFATAFLSFLNQLRQSVRLISIEGLYLRNFYPRSLPTKFSNLARPLHFERLDYSSAVPICVGWNIPEFDGFATRIDTLVLDDFTMLECELSYDLWCPKILQLFFRRVGKRIQRMIVILPQNTETKYMSQIDALHRYALLDLSKCSELHTIELEIIGFEVRGEDLYVPINQSQPGLPEFQMAIMQKVLSSLPSLVLQHLTLAIRFRRPWRIESGDTESIHTGPGIEWTKEIRRIKRMFPRLEGIDVVLDLPSASRFKMDGSAERDKDEIMGKLGMEELKGEEKVTISTRFMQ